MINIKFLYLPAIHWDQLDSCCYWPPAISFNRIITFLLVLDFAKSCQALCTCQKNVIKIMDLQLRYYYYFLYDEMYIILKGKSCDLKIKTPT